MELHNPTPTQAEVLDSTPPPASGPRESTTASDGFYKAKRETIAAFEREYFTGLAKRCKGNVSEMARQSAMKRHHVRAYLRRYEIDRHAP